MSKYFEPSKECRNFKASSFVGKKVNLQLQHTDASKTVITPVKKATKQYVYTRFKTVLGDLHIGDWADCVLGKEKEELPAKIVRASLLEASNGGRSDWQEYDSYKAFYNKQRKEMCFKKYRGGLFYCMGHPGNADEADIRLVLQVKDKTITLTGRAYALHAPQEWYSECVLEGHPDLDKFPKGFYKDAEEALHFFNDKPVDDLFGTRFFPVMVFPKKEKFIKVARDLSYAPKSCSDPVIGKKYIVYGLRCKEYQLDVIKEIYASGGFIARSMQYEW